MQHLISSSMAWVVVGLFSKIIDFKKTPRKKSKGVKSLDADIERLDSPIHDLYIFFLGFFEVDNFRVVSKTLNSTTGKWQIQQLNCISGCVDLRRLGVLLKPQALHIHFFNFRPEKNWLSFHDIDFGFHDCVLVGTPFIWCKKNNPASLKKIRHNCHVDRHI